MKLWADRRRLGSIAAPASWMLDNPWLCFVSRSREPAPGKVASSHAHTSQFALMRAKPRKDEKEDNGKSESPQLLVPFDREAFQDFQSRGVFGSLRLSH